jgi:hypothetical protein
MTNTTTELVPLDAVTSSGAERETELSTTAIVLSGTDAKRLETQLAQLETMQRGLHLNAKYYEFEAVGETVRGVYIGIRTIWKNADGEKKPIPAACWIDADKQLWINAGKILVSQLESVPINTAIEIVYTERLKMNLGVAKSYDVCTLY